MKQLVTYKVGQKVKILDGNTIHCGTYWSPAMDQYIGKTAKIIGVYANI